MNNTGLENTLSKAFNKLKSIQFKSVKLRELSSFVRQLATMSSAGVPLYQAIGTIYEAMEESALKSVVGTIKDKIKSGTTFSQCLEEHAEVFPPLMSGLVKVGEVTGALETVLVRYADLLEWQEEFRSRIITMLIYPALMIILGVAVLIFIITFILPRFVSLFAEYNQALPMPTLILLGISNFIANFWWLIIIIVTALVVLFNIYYKTKDGRKRVESIILKLPLVGNAVHKAIISRFSFILGIMVGSGVPLLQAISITSGTIGNRVLSDYLASAAKSVERGDSLSKSLKDCPFFPKSVIQMIHVGEETGKMEAILTKIASSYERDLEITTRRLIILFEPLTIILIAFFVGFVAVAILLPILSVSTVIK